jgi:catechol 2,3-dioxygenase-like lactoylglutathione lyase family enzyme
MVPAEVDMRGVVHHIELYVKNLTISTSFWGWLLAELGYREYQRWDAGVSYRLADTYIVFVQAESRFLDVPYHRCRAGLNHLAFHGGNRAQVDAITEKLRARGTSILYEDRHPYAGGPDYHAVYFEDPDRMKVEIVADEK